MNNEIVAYYFPDYIKNDEQGNATFVAEEIEYIVYLGDEVNNRYTLSTPEVMLLFVALNYHGYTDYTVGYSGRVVTSVHYKVYDEESLRIVNEAIINPPDDVEWNGRNLENIAPFGFVYATEEYPYQDITVRINTKDGLLEASGKVTNEEEYDEVWNGIIDKLYKYIIDDECLEEYLLYHKAVIQNAEGTVVSEKETTYTITQALFKYLINGLKVVVPVKS